LDIQKAFPMSDLALFTERQSFRQWWLWVILIGINGLFLFAVIVQIGTGRPVGDKPASDMGLLVMLALSLVITGIFTRFRLETRISREAVRIRFSPLHRSWRVYPWTDIREARIRSYSPIREYGGWGIRYGLGGRGMAYNVAGNQGLQLVFNNGRRLLIGTGKAEELALVLEKLQRDRENISEDGRVG
jgi:hypothetical protein